jgi:hypothetical protein
MPPIPLPLPARARARRLLAAAGIASLGLGGLPAGLLTPASAASGGRVFAFGGATDAGSPTEALAGMAVIPSGTGYWTVTPNGTVRSFGDAPDLGSSSRPGAVDIAAARSGRGYWVAFADGGVLAYGDSRFKGSMGGKPLNSPIVGITPTPSGGGYWLVAADGGVFSFGDARYLGSMGGTKLVAPITAIAATPTGRGYWMAAEDGGVFSFGDADFRGSISTGGITSMAAAPKGMGYWLVAGNGDVHAFGDAPDLGDLDVSSAVVDITPRPQVDGYWLATGDVAAAAAGYRGAAAGDPPDSDWDRLAQCEASGNWGARGNGYEGGLQFLNSTWLGYGGGEFAEHAYDAPREAQIEIGRRVWRERGWSPWPSCARQLGWR